MTRAEKELRIASALNPLARAWHSAADGALAGLGIKSAAAWCIVHLARLGPNVRQTELAEAIGITEPSLARTLQLVIAEGLIERRIDEQDRRSNRIGLTEHGMRLAHAAEDRLAAVRRDLLADASSEDLDRLLALFDGIGERLSERRLTL